MALAISHEDTQVLLRDKNVLQDSTLDKYRHAGQISQTALAFVSNLINQSYHHQTGARVPIHELCLLTDSFLSTCLESAFKNKVNERGIAHPTTIDVDELASGWCPELDDVDVLKNWNKNVSADEADSTVNGYKRCIDGFLQPGDVVTITLGCHIDGYTSQVSHTMVIYPTAENEQNVKVPTGPLLAGKADAVAAAHIAMETVVALLGCALTPEKLPQSLTAVAGGAKVTGTLIRTVVDTIAATYNCAVVPGSRVRRIRRFLAGQSEGLVAEREYKGVAWSEANQEASLLQRSAASAADSDDISQELVQLDQKTKDFAQRKVLNDSAVPTDDFVVSTGEVYLIDLKLAPLDGLTLGLVTLETVDNFSGKSHRNNQLVARPGSFVRDFSHSHTLKLKTSRQLLTKIDQQGVYPVKLSHMSEHFPLDVEAPQLQIPDIAKDLKSFRLGISEIANNYLTVTKPIQIAKFLPWQTVLNSANPTGLQGYDAENPTLPGMELPLPRLGMSSLKLKALLKKDSVSIPVARECSTVVLCGSDVSATGKSEILRLTGGSKTCTPSWVHSKYQLDQEDPLVQGIFQLAELAKDKRFGIVVRETQPLKKRGVHAANPQDVEMAWIK